MGETTEPARVMRVHRYAGRARAHHRGVMVSLLLVLAMTLAACGGGEDEPADDVEPEASTDAGAGDSEQEEEPEADAGEEPEAEPEAEAAGDDVFDPDDPLRLMDGQLPQTSSGFPEGPITFYFPNDVGHTDQVMGTLAAEIGREVSPVPIETEAVPSAPPEYGYALIDHIAGQPRGDQPAYHPIFTSLFGTATKPWTVETLCEVDPQSLEMLTSMATGPYGFVVSEDSEMQSMDDVVAWLEENPDAPVLTSPIGSGIHAALAVFAQEAGLEPLNFLPTDGSADTRNVLLGGGAEFGSMVIGPGGEEGLRVLAVAGDQRFPPPLDDVPTMQELGWNVPGASARGFILVEGVDEEHKAWIMALASHIAQDPRWTEQNPGMILDPLPPDETQESVQTYLESTLPQLEAADVTVCPLDRL